MPDSIIIATDAGRFDLLNPRAEDVDIDDMLRNLSRMYRWTGAGRLTVLQHQMHVALILERDGASRNTILAGMVHDLHEYVTGDIPAPLLDELQVMPTNDAYPEDGRWDAGSLRMIQMRIQWAINARLDIDLSNADFAAVARADTLARDQERADVFPGWLERIAALSPDEAVRRYRRGMEQLGVTLP